MKNKKAMAVIAAATIITTTSLTGCSLNNTFDPSKENITYKYGVVGYDEITEENNNMQEQENDTESAEDIPEYNPNEEPMATDYGVIQLK